MDPELMAAADRMWNAAETLDDLRGGTDAWGWTMGQALQLNRDGRAEDPDAVLAVARALEARVERERAA